MPASSTLVPVFAAAILTVADYVFHALFTQPMETPFYFLGVKLVGGFVLTYLVYVAGVVEPLRKTGPVVVSLVFGLVVSAYYLTADLFGYRSDLYAHPVPTVGFLPAPLDLLGWPLWHALFYFVGLQVAIWLVFVCMRPVAERGQAE